MLTVVIPATDAPPTLARCLLALERSSEAHALEVVSRDSEVHPQIGQVADDGAVERPKPREIERRDGGDASQGALPHLHHRGLALGVAVVRRQPGLQRGVDPAAEGGGVAVGEDGVHRFALEWTE